MLTKLDMAFRSLTDSRTQGQRWRTETSRELPLWALEPGGCTTPEQE